MKIIKSLEESAFLTKDAGKTTKNEVKEQKGGFLTMLSGTLGPSLLGNLLHGKAQLEQVKALFERAGFLMLHHPLTNFKIQKYYQNELKFNDVYSRKKLPKI